MLLADFGLSCVMASSAAPAAMSRAGTGTYFAPEQARGRTYDHKVARHVAGLGVSELGERETGGERE